MKKSKSAKPIIARNTRQRSVILQILGARKTPISAPDILNYAKAKIPEINKTTIYRILERLGREKIVDQVNLKAGTVYYELGEQGRHHHHFICDACASIFCLDSCPSEIKSMLPRGFLMTAHEVTLRGLCAACR